MTILQELEATTKLVYELETKLINAKQLVKELKHKREVELLRENDGWSSDPPPDDTDSSLGWWLWSDGKHTEPVQIDWSGHPEYMDVLITGTSLGIHSYIDHRIPLCRFHRQRSGMWKRLELPKVPELELVPKS